MHPTTLDAATAAHLAHGAMAGADPLTDSLFSQLDACAAEGAQPPSTHGAGLTTLQLAALADAEDDPLLDWLIPAGITIGAALSALYPWGWPL